MNDASVSVRRLAVGLFVISFAVTMGSNVGLAIVLERSGPQALPLLMIANAVLLSAASAFVTLAARGAVLGALMASLVIAAVLAGICGVGELAHARWSAWGIYLIASVVADLSAALFWSLANELFDARSAKRVFPRVGAAGTAGGVVSGLVAHTGASHLGAHGLIAVWLGSLLMAAAWAFVTKASRKDPPPTVWSSRRKTVAAVGARRVSHEDQALVRSLSVGLVIIIGVTLVGRFLYARAIAEAFGMDAAAIAATNGVLIGIASVMTASVQLFLTPFLLARWGVKVVSLVYPALLLATFGLLGVRFGLATGVVAFFVTGVLRRAVQGPIESVLPTALMPAHASRTILLLTAINAPVGMLLAGAALELGRGRSATAIAWLGAFLAVLLGVVSVWRSRSYRAALLLRLAKGGSDLRRRLMGAMSSTREARALLSEELRDDDPALVEKLETLAQAQRERRRPWARSAGTYRNVIDARLAEAWRLEAALARMTLLIPLVERIGLAVGAEKAARRFGPPSADPILDLLAVPDEWVRACTAYAVADLDPSPYQARLRELGRTSNDPFLQLGIARALAPAPQAHSESS